MYKDVLYNIYLGVTVKSVLQYRVACSDITYHAVRLKTDL